jgi:hypothetical protein
VPKRRTRNLKLPVHFALQKVSKRTGRKFDFGHFDRALSYPQALLSFQSWRAVGKLKIELQSRLQSHTAFLFPHFMESGIVLIPIAPQQWRTKIPQESRGFHKCRQAKKSVWGAFSASY